MSGLQELRHTRALRRPLLAMVGRVLRPLRGGVGFWQRAFYDAMPVPYLVVGAHEPFVVSTRDKVIGRELFQRSEFDLHKLVTALQVLEEQGCVRPDHLIDVGANIGSICVPAVARGLIATATAIEPHPGNLRLLHANIALNDMLDKVRVVAAAVGATSDETLHLEESQYNSGNHSVAPSGLATRAFRLDDLEVPSESSLLWMDIEGYEGHALRGATRLLAANVPIVSELNPGFLRKQAGLGMFCEALAGRRVFDLSEPSEETTLARILDRHAATYTDILAI